MNPTLTLSDALAFVADAAERDPALRTMIASRLGLTDPKTKDFGPRPTGLPDLKALSALQVSVFDNGPSPIVAKIEYWTEDGYALPGKNGYVKMSSIKLYPQKKFLQNLRKQRSSTLSPEWIEIMRDIADSYSEDHLFGPVFVSKPGHGSSYIEGQIVIAEIDGGVVHEVKIVSHTQRITATAFTKRSHNDKALADNLMGSARITFRGDSNIDWSTEAGLVV